MKIRIHFSRESLLFKLNEFIEYVELTDFREIWPELALMTKKQKCVGDFFFFILNIFPEAASHASRFGNCSMLELDSP